MDEDGFFDPIDDDGCIVKLVDFGNAEMTSLCDEYRVTTSPYRSPEVLICTPWTSKIDMWSLGCLVAELYTGKVMFPVHENEEALHVEMIRLIVGDIPDYMIQKVRSSFTRRLRTTALSLLSPQGRRRLAVARSLDCDLAAYPELLWFVQRLLEIDPERRASVDESLSAAFIIS
jgi:dual-specificity kinase